MAKRPPKRAERSTRLEQQRTLEKLRADRERLFVLEPGGRPERPIEVHAAAVIETQATSLPCPRCGGAQKVTEHSASVRFGVRLREAKLRCQKCGSSRSLWFKIVGSNLN
jgi:transposase-like protein